VIAVTFDDELDLVAAPPLSTTPEKPRGWVEEPRMGGWSATLVPRRLIMWLAPPIFFPLLALYAFSLGVAMHSFVVTAAVIVSFLAALGAALAYRLRRWSFAFEGGRFRVNARGRHEDIALDEILRFVAELPPRKTRGNFQLRVLRTNARSTSVPLFVESADEAQFIADRANALLASGGRAGSFGYRGEQVRVAEDEPRVRVDVAEDEPVSEDATPSGRARASQLR
jgi:hypothetical protein